MAVVRIPSEQAVLSEPEAVTAFLGRFGIDYQRWISDRAIGPEVGTDDLLQAFGREIDALKARGGYRAVDVIDVGPDTPNLDAMLARFSREHWHDEDEVRFVVEGRGLFHIHP